MGRRVVTKKDTPRIKAYALAEGAAQPQPDDMLTRLVKYIPAEIITAFITIQGIISSTAEPPVAAFWILFIALLVLTPLYVWRVTTEPGKPPAVAQILVSTISFVVWVFAIGGPFVYLSWYQPVYGALILPVFTIAVPVILGAKPKSG